MCKAGSCCYDKTTEILTTKGWKLIKNIDIVNDIVITFNLETSQIGESKIDAIHIMQTDEILYELKDENIDLIVTETHGMLYKDNDIINIVPLNKLINNEKNILLLRYNNKTSELEYINFNMKNISACLKNHIKEVVNVSTHDDNIVMVRNNNSYGIFGTDFML